MYCNIMAIQGKNKTAVRLVKTAVWLAEVTLQSITFMLGFEYTPVLGSNQKIHETGSWRPFGGLVMFY